MVDAQSMAMPGAAIEPHQIPAARREPPAAPLPRGRAPFLIFVVLVSGGLGFWIFNEATNILRSAESGTGADWLERLSQGRWIAAGGVLGGGIFLGLLVILVLRSVENSWSQHLQAVRTQVEGDADVLADRLRIQVAQKIRSETHLLRIRSELESQVASLSSSNEEMKEELDRRKRNERSMAVQSQHLAASKDVLQIHVQARQQELQKLQRQYELILNAAGEGICGVDSDGKITFVNPTAARLMGLEVEKMVGSKETDLFGRMPQGDTTLSTKKAVGKPAEVTLTRADQSAFTAEFMRSQIVENDRVVGRVVLFQDITERKQAAEALEHKANELARSNAELEQFAFVASHDLQEPLRKIRAFGDRLKMKCEAALPADGADYLERMQNAAARMQTLIADLLTFSRVISRTEPFVEVDLARVTQEVLGDLEVRIEKVGAAIEVGDLPKIEADPMQIRQLLQNLMSNALKFQRPEVKPKVQIAARIVPQDDEYASETGPLCELRIQDNGIGFDEKYLEKIFAVFQRLHNRQEYEGTGIGLAVCRRIVDRHGGSITARSKSGEGATFIVQLPVKRRAKDK